MRTLFPLLVVMALCGGMAHAQVLINELDSDTPGTDALEFIELYGAPNTSLDGLVVVFYNGSSDVSYAAYDLDGYSTDANGYFLMGNAAVVPAPSIVFAGNFLQNGQDAVALYTANASDFPNNTPVTLTNLVDALVYDTADADDPGLLPLLLAGPQIDEAGNGASDGNSCQRCQDGAGGARVTTHYVVIPPTPGAANNGTCPAEEQACCFEDGSCQDLLAADCEAAGGVVYDGACATVTCPVPPAEMSLCEAIMDDENGDPVHYLTVVHITSPLLVLSDADTYTDGSVDCGATDGTCCVNLFDFNNTTVLMAGDMVDVIGTVNRYNGKAELTNLTVTVLSSGNPLPPPEEITAEELFVNGELYESCLISICGLTITDLGQAWPAAGANANVDVVDDTGYHIQLRVDKETDIDGTPIPVQPFTCIGLGCQFDIATPYFDGYQILPRMRADILDGVDCPVPVQACCFADGTCQLITPEECLAAGGQVYPQMSCDPNPCPQPQACCFGYDCMILQPDDCLGQGGTVYPELVCDPNPCPLPEFACCFVDGSCEVMNEMECSQAGGTLYMEPSCDPNPCPAPEYACCFPLDEACYMMTEEACLAGGGVWYDLQVCSDAGGAFTCPLWRVCCVNEVCEITTDAGCLDLGGVWHPEWTSCAPTNPCETPVPVTPDSWGAIKSVYR